MMFARLRFAFVSLALVLTAIPARSDDDVAAFYKGRTLQVVSSFGEGGLYSVVTRLVADHLPKYLPGRPSAIAQSMPGAAGFRQMNYLYNIAPKDGTVIALMYDNVPTAQLLQPDDSLKFDTRRFGMLGSLNKGEAGLVGILKRAGITSLDDARQKPAVFGSTGTSSGQYTVPAAMNKMFGTRFKIIPGYKTTPEIYLSMERGELDGVYGTAEAMAENRPQWIAEHRFNWLAQLNDVRAPDYADVPLLQELAQAPLDKAAFRFLALARVPGKMFVTPPDIPAARLEALRAAFAVMVRDQAFIDDIAKTTQKLDVRTWQEAEAIIRETAETPPDVIAYVRDLLKIGN
jgi:tripartite-type tricarboxylate transporter receptor subunit TctC